MTSSDTAPEQYSFSRYLEAKRTVDDRARNERVKTALVEWLAEHPTETPISVCEIGAGTGRLIEAIAAWTSAPIEYTAVDTDTSLLAEAAARLTGPEAPAAEQGLGAFEAHQPIRYAPSSRPAPVTVSLHGADALAYLADRTNEFDLVIGQAFLDLTDVYAALEVIADSLRPGGRGYFPITFDGVTEFRPQIDPDLDRRIQETFHSHMDDTVKASGATGDSQAGRRLLTAAPRTDGTVVAAGGSDWIVTPQDNAYPADEAYFLHHIIDIIESAVASEGEVDREALRNWAQRRHEQVHAGELVYMTHQLDVLVGWETASEDR